MLPTVAAGDADADVDANAVTWFVPAASRNRARALRSPSPRAGRAEVGVLMDKLIGLLGMDPESRSDKAAVLASTIQEIERLQGKLAALREAGESRHSAARTLCGGICLNSALDEEPLPTPTDGSGAAIAALSSFNI